MKATDGKIDAARIDLLLGDLRLSGVKLVWAALAATADKRAILACWVSDARAVENSPTLRRLDSGAVVEVGAILEALRGLDRSGGVVVRLPARARRRSEPGDDDPSPTPARSGIPPRPIHVDAYGAPRRYVGGAI